MINHNRLRLTKLAFALSLVLAGPAMAQNTTSAINGRISSSDGKPASGAQVSIRHTESGSVSNVTADADGRYSARGLRVGGPYTVTITKDGVTETREGIYLQLAETAAVDATIGAPAMQTVTIAGTATSNKFNKSAMGAGTSIGRAELNNLASIQRSLSDYARKDPRLSQTDKERGEISAGGQNSRFNSITVDGVSISDTFGLEGNGLPTNKQPISIDAIQSVQVNISNYDVTQKGYTGANINAVTKSGTNDWKGSLYYVFRDDKMSGKRFNRTSNTYTDTPEFEESTKGFTLGGPLIKDKLFIFVNAEDFASSRSGPSFGPLGSSLTNAGITTSSIAAAQNIAKTKYNFDAGSADIPSGLEQTTEERLIKLDWNINDDHRASLRWQSTKQGEPQFSGFTANGIALTSYLWNEKKDNDSTVLQWFGDWTPSFNTELKVYTRSMGKSNENNAYLPSILLQFPGALPPGTPASVATGTRFLNFGTEFSRQFNTLATDTSGAYLGATWIKGDHEIKFGGDYDSNKIYNAFAQGVNGSYTFGCRDSTTTLTYTSLPSGIVCSTATAAAVEAATLENFSIGRPTQYSAVMPQAGRTLNDVTANWTLKAAGLFVQDTWTVNKNLTLTYGVRYDSYSTSDRPPSNPAVALPKVGGTYAAVVANLKRDTGGFGLDNTVTIDGDSLVQPRFGFNYKLNTARPAQIRGGVGLFGGSALNVWLGNPWANSGVAVYTTGCGGSFTACGSNGGTFNADPTKQPILSGSPAASAVDILMPGIAQPSVWKLNLGGEYELPWGGLVVGLEYMKTDVNKGLFYRQINIGAPSRIGPDGRELFWTEPGYIDTCANGTGGFNSSGACTGFRNRALSNASFLNVSLATNTKKGGGNTATLSLANSRNRDFKWDVAYTYTDALEVSPLSSSTSGSNFGSRAIFNPNEEVLANSSYLVRDRVSASLSWEKRWFGKYKTTFGAFYEGRTGKPYSWTFNNDMNGDSTASNDLMYIPKGFGSGEVIFRGDTATDKTNETKFWATVNGNKELARAIGGVTKRNDSYAPWTNSIDMRVSQEIPGFLAGHKGNLVLDFFNFGNMLNKKWGRINEVSFASAGGNARSFVDYAGMKDGKYVYQVRAEVEDYVVKQARGESQWAVQATLRYEF